MERAIAVLEGEQGEWIKLADASKGSGDPWAAFDRASYRASGLAIGQAIDKLRAEVDAERKRLKEAVARLEGRAEGRTP